VQHIDENFLPVLADILTTNSHFDVKIANGSNQMTPGDVYLAPLKGKMIFLQDGSMLVDHSQKWSEPYSPCIDDVIESLSSIYKEQSGAIIFSGMGQDGLNGAKKMRALGGSIWAQSIDTCANSSMPEAVINSELTELVANPEVLAERLSEFVKKH
jgi:chemotaxis response regulator CheB